MTTVSLSPVGGAGSGTQFFSDNGAPLLGGKLYTYAAGTTTSKATYTTSAGSTAHANPIVLNSVGRCGEVWLLFGEAYKFVLTDSLGGAVGEWDNIYGTAPTTAYALTTDLTTHEADTTTHGATGAVVGTTNTQTLTNKTFTAPTTNGGTSNGETINDPVIGSSEWTTANHKHYNAATGGLLPIPGMRSGLNISNSAGDTVNDIRVEAGSITDSTGSYHLRLSGALIGQLDGNFVAGSGQGKLDTGARAEATSYFIYVIGNTAGTLNDILFSASATNPTLPAGYTLKAYSGRSFYTLAGGAGIVPLLEVNGKIFLKSPVESRTDTILPTAAESTTLGVPLGLAVNAIFTVSCTEITTATVKHYGILSNTDLGDIAPTASVYDFLFTTNNASGCGAYSSFTRPTNTSGAITTRFDVTGSDSAYSLTTRGWEIPPA